MRIIVDFIDQAIIHANDDEKLETLAAEVSDFMSDKPLFAF
jgi:hypothetical protein